MPAFATPFTNELHTNYVPSSLDREQIHALLVEPKKRLLELNDRIAEMEQILGPLRQERDSLVDEIQQHTRLLAPFHRFPDDMLREVFLACLPDEHNAVMSLKEAPLVLGRVCRHWRSVLYSTPSLWASLHIPYPHAMFEPQPRDIEVWRLIEADQEKLRTHQTAVKAWILRSGECPLSLSFNCIAGEANSVGTNPANNVIHTIQSYLDIILSVSHRWHTLELYLPVGNLFDRIAFLQQTSVPMLKHLRLTFSGSMSLEERLAWSSGTFLNSISPYSLEFTSIPFRPSSVSTGFWSSLSDLTLDNKTSSRSRTLSTIAEAHFIFSKCRRLIHCSLEIFDLPEATSPSGVISLPYLKSLSIIDSCPSLSSLFEWFTDLSVLRGVSYHTKIRPSYQQHSPLVTLLSRTNGQLRHLNTNLSYYTLADLRAIFALVPNLTHFTDEYSPVAPKARNPHLPKSFSIGNVFLNLLTPIEGGPTYGARLQVLRIQKSQCNDTDVLVFLQRRLHASRRRPGGVNGDVVAPLREFRGLLTYPVQLDLAALLAEYVEDGSLMLDITHANSTLPKTGWTRIHVWDGLVKRSIPDIVRACNS